MKNHAYQKKKLFCWKQISVKIKSKNEQSRNKVLYKKKIRIFTKNEKEKISNHLIIRAYLSSLNSNTLNVYIIYIKFWKYLKAQVKKCN